MLGVITESGLFTRRDELARNIQHHALALGATILLLTTPYQSASAGSSSNARQTSGQVRPSATLQVPSSRRKICIAGLAHRVTC